MRLLTFLWLAGLLGLASCDSAAACRRVCTTGRACGDTCIAANQTCNTPPGEACNG